MNPVRLAIIGCTGRTGSAVVRLAAAEPTVRICCAVAADGDPRLGRDVGEALGLARLGVPITTTCAAPCDVAIEFTTPASCAEWARWCAAQHVALISGTTGLDAAQHAAIEEASRAVPVLWAANMSHGVQVLLKLVATAAAVLADWDAEIVESHHRHKVDAPSGTAQALLAAICRARGTDPAATAVVGRCGAVGPRPVGQVGVHAVRAGENIGEHTVMFATAGEELTLRHRALAREAFAAGALRAARWLVGRPAGRYSLADVTEDVQG